MTYAEKLKDPRWLRVRNAVMFRDKWTCQECKRQQKYPDFPTYKRGIILNVHHIKYIGNYPWETPMEFLKTLCEDCHNIEHCSPRTVDLFKILVNKFKA